MTVQVPSCKERPAAIRSRLTHARGIAPATVPVIPHPVIGRAITGQTIPALWRPRTEHRLHRPPSARLLARCLLASVITRGLRAERGQGGSEAHLLGSGLPSSLSTTPNRLICTHRAPLTYHFDRNSYSIWVLLIRRRMLCPSRWVIPGLAGGVTGWLAGQRVVGGSRSSGGCRHRVKMVGVDSRGRARVPV